MQNRFASLFIAGLLPLLLFRWFAPESAVEIDFWLMWVVAMIAVGLPLLYAEIGLAHRSLKIPAVGIQELTRQADTSTIWRSFVWLTVILSLVVAALNVDAVSINLLKASSALGVPLDIPEFALAAIMMVIAGMLSLLGGGSLIAALGLIVIAIVISAFHNLSTLHFVMTEATLGEWAKAVVLALVSVGAGTGLYWFNSPRVATMDHIDDPKAVRYVATKTVLPIWLTQLVAGSIALVLTVGNMPPVAIIVFALGVLAAAAFFMFYANTQIATLFQRFGIWIATVVSIVLGVLLVVLLTPELLSLILVILSILSALVLAIFSGWQMKISHMRKSLNFSSEAIYNVWRVAIRIIVPLCIIIAIIGWFM